MIRYDYITVAVQTRDHSPSGLADEVQQQMDKAGNLGYRHVSTTLVDTTLLIIMERSVG